MAGFAVGILSPGKRTNQVKRKQTHGLTPSEKIAKLDKPEDEVWFGEEGGRQPAARWEQKANTEERAPPLRRRLTPMSELLDSLLETETSSSSSSRRKEEKRSMTITEETPPPSITRKLTPMSNLLESLLEDTPVKERGDGPVFFPVEVDTDKLLDWKEKLKESEEEKLGKSPTKLGRSPAKREPNNNELERGTLVNVNNTDIALFIRGDHHCNGKQVSPRWRPAPPWRHRAPPRQVPLCEMPLAQVGFLCLVKRSKSRKSRRIARLKGGDLCFPDRKK